MDLLKEIIIIIMSVMSNYSCRLVKFPDAHWVGNRLCGSLAGFSYEISSQIK